MAHNAYFARVLWYLAGSDVESACNKHFWVLRREKMIRKGTTRSGVCDSIWFLAIFMSLIHQDDFIVHILIALNCLNDLVVVLIMFCIINYHKSCQKELKMRLLAILSSLVGWIGLILHIMIVQKIFNICQWLLAMNDLLTMHGKHNLSIIYPKMMVFGCMGMVVLLHP